MVFLLPTGSHDPAMDPFLDVFFRTLGHPVVMTLLALFVAVLFARRFLLGAPGADAGTHTGARTAANDDGAIASAAAMVAQGSSDPCSGDCCSAEQ